MVAAVTAARASAVAERETKPFRVVARTSTASPTTVSATSATAKSRVARAAAVPPALSMPSDAQPAAHMPRMDSAASNAASLRRRAVVESHRAAPSAAVRSSLATWSVMRASSVRTSSRICPHAASRAWAWTSAGTHTRLFVSAHSPWGYVPRAAQSIYASDAAVSATSTVARTARYWVQ